MFWIIGFLILGVIGAIGVLIAAFGRNDDPNSIPRGAGWAVIVVVAVLQIGLFIVSSVHVVDARNVGVVRSFGSIKGQVGEGTQFTWPWQSVEEWDIREQTVILEMEAASKDGQVVYTKVLLNFDVSTTDVQSLAREVGKNYVDRVVIPRTTQAIKELTDDFQALEIINKRPEIRLSAEKRLSDELAPYSLTIKSIIIENLDFSDAFNASLEEKVAAEQQALAEVFRAQQRVTAAQAEADSIKVRAEQQALANQLLTSSLTPALIQYQTIQNLSDNIQIMVVPSEGGFLFQLPQLNTGQ